MKNKIYTIFNTEIDNIIKNNNTISIFLVGSSKNIDLRSPNANINDIDLFVFVNQGENQVRLVKEIDNIEFDINYFSRNGFKNLMDEKEYFFLKEMKDAVIIYDKNNTAFNIINLCKMKYIEGPKKISNDEKQFLKSEIGSKISRLSNQEKFDNFEYEFLTRLYLKDIIIGYFIIKDKWIPKDKNLLKSLKIEDEKLFSMIEEVHQSCNYKNLFKAYDYVFKDVSTNKIIKITY